MLPKVYLINDDQANWALADDWRLTAGALDGAVDFTSLEACEVVHAIWWEELSRLSDAQLAGKRVVCLVSGEPYRYMTMPGFRRTIPRVGLWIGQTRQAMEELAGLGLRAAYIPYAVDTGVFRPLPADDSRIRNLREQWAIPSDRYLIGNIHRDSEGHNLNSPKLVKGPDIFAEILRELQAQDLPIHAVLAGPRRHWLRGRLRELGIPFTFVGEQVEGDDFPANVLPQETINTLYNLIDLYVISSRSEGGPRSTLEAAAARCKMVSSRVGLSLDLLEPASLFSAPDEAVAIIATDITEHRLACTIDPQYQRLQECHQPETVTPLWRELYAGLDLPAYTPPPPPPPPTPSLFTWFRRRLGPQLTVSIWQTFFKPPYGGGNQFMLALRKALSRKGVAVKANVLGDSVDVYLLNAVHFDVERFIAYRQRRRLRVVQRIDGPISLSRGQNKELDDLTYQLNADFANATVIQSAWTYRRIIDFGYQPISASIIHNAVDPDIFHRQGRMPFDPKRKIRLISSSWSNNPRKGGPVYKWIEDRLDWDRFEFTFVGRASESFDRIRRIDPVPSEELADQLRQHDIYITASQRDSCSNAVIEALACGLPVLYMNDGGNPEVVGAGGLPFTDNEEILPQLERLVEHYEMYQHLITVNSLDDVAEKYLALLREAAG